VIGGISLLKAKFGLLKEEGNKYKSKILILCPREAEYRQTSKQCLLFYKLSEDFYYFHLAWGENLNLSSFDCYKGKLKKIISFLGSVRKNALLVLERNIILFVFLGLIVLLAVLWWMTGQFVDLIFLRYGAGGHFIVLYVGLNILVFLIAMAKAIRYLR
jgi:hypothetical protein